MSGPGSLALVEMFHEEPWLLTTPVVLALAPACPHVACINRGRNMRHPQACACKACNLRMSLLTCEQGEDAWKRVRGRGDEGIGIQYALIGQLGQVAGRCAGDELCEVHLMHAVHTSHSITPSIIISTRSSCHSSAKDVPKISQYKVNWDCHQDQT